MKLESAAGLAAQKHVETGRNRPLVWVCTCTKAKQSCTRLSSSYLRKKKKKDEVWRPAPNCSTHTFKHHKSGGEIDNLSRNVKESDFKKEILDLLLSLDPHQNEMGSSLASIPSF